MLVEIGPGPAVWIVQIRIVSLYGMLAKSV